MRMKIFIIVIIVAAIIGGFIGDEINGNGFSILGATIGGGLTFLILIGLGAFFYNQDEKKKNTQHKLPPKIAEINKNRCEFEKYSLMGALYDLHIQDIEDAKNGKVNERRLIPHHAIKRDIAIKAYEKDFYNLSDSMQDLNRDDFLLKIETIKQLDQFQLDKLIGIMKQERGDLVDIEKQVRLEKQTYSIVKPLFY